MNASKETAKEAQVAFSDLWLLIPDKEKFKLGAKRATVEGFLTAAERKLPSEAAYAKDKERRKAKK